MPGPPGEQIHSSSVAVGEVRCSGTVPASASQCQQTRCQLARATHDPSYCESCRVRGLCVVPLWPSAVSSHPEPHTGLAQSCVHRVDSPPTGGGGNGGSTGSPWLGKLGDRLGHWPGPACSPMTEPWARRADIPSFTSCHSSLAPGLGHVHAHCVWRGHCAQDLVGSPRPGLP